MTGQYFDYTTRSGHVSFPLGGIGTGCIGLSGSGRLIDWEIMNRPNKGGSNGFSHFAIRAQAGGRVLDARVLNGPFSGPAYGQGDGEWKVGFGARREDMPGMPNFGDVRMTGEFPVANLSFSDPRFPGQVELTAFSPFIPSNEDDCSAPAAFFEWTVFNDTDQEIDYSLIGNLSNPAPGPQDTDFLDTPYGKGVDIRAQRNSEKPEEYGEMVLACDADDVCRQHHWYRGSWFDGLEVYWRDITTPGPIPDRHYPGPRVFGGAFLTQTDQALLAGNVRIKPGERRTIRFVIAWYFPTYKKYWAEGCGNDQKQCGSSNCWDNYYATKWRSARDVADFALSEWDRLRSETLKFRDVLFRSTLPDSVLDAVSANIGILKSPTVIRLTDGTLYGFEGCHQDAGCCEGSCTHVWNYQQALGFLFPALQRGIISLDYAQNLSSETGGMAFRLQLPVGSERTEFRPCVDGHFGNVMKVFREWKLSGNDRWLQSVWPNVKSSMEYAWHPENTDRWDPEKSGVIKGRQHHTLDMELFGPNSWLTGFYLGALSAAAEMAAYLGEDDISEEYRTIFETGRRWVDENLFNGKFFCQQVDLNDAKQLDNYLGKKETAQYVRSHYWSEEHGQLKYQIGDGCGIDQVLPQWHADLYGLPAIFNRNKYAAALNSIYENNFKPRLGDTPNPCRVFGFGDEAGTVICEWPDDVVRPAFPVVYAQETMHGFEYAFGSALLQAGEIEKGIEVFKAVRDRYRGDRRNPWNEIECGSHYARSMASYGGLIALAGFEFDLTEGRIGFSPLVSDQGRFRAFWSVDNAWGEVFVEEGVFRLDVLYGTLALERLSLGCLRIPSTFECLGDAEAIGIDEHSGDILLSPGKYAAGARIELLADCITLQGVPDVTEVAAG